jgi:hypothetical protein
MQPCAWLTRQLPHSFRRHCCSEHEARTLLSFLLTSTTVALMFFLRKLGAVVGLCDRMAVSEAALLKQVRGESAGLGSPPLPLPPRPSPALKRAGGAVAAGSHPVSASCCKNHRRARLGLRARLLAYRLFLQHIPCWVCVCFV